MREGWEGGGGRGVFGRLSGKKVLRIELVTRDYFSMCKRHKFGSLCILTMQLNVKKKEKKKKTCTRTSFVYLYC